MTDRKNILTSLAAAIVLLPGLSARAEEGGITLKDHIKPVLAEYCFDCHNAKKAKGDLDLELYTENPKLYENREIWEKVVELVESGEMPPEKKPKLMEDQKEMLIHYVDGQLAKFDCDLDPNPGKVTIRRLNRDEYRNTIRDLLRVDFNPEDFPNDEVGYGFDNIGDVLSLPPMLMEKYLAAAEEVVKKAIVTDVAPRSQVKRLKGQEFHGGADGTQPVEGNTLGLMREVEVKRGFEFPVKGDYVIRFLAYGDQAGPELPKMAIRVAGQEPKVVEVKNTRKPEAYELRVTVDAGWKDISVAYLNNYVDEGNPDPKLRGDRNLYLAAVEIEQPASAPALPESHRQLITRLPEPGQEREVAKEILGKFASRAYRRPVDDAEVERLTRFVDLAMKEGGNFLEGIQVAVQAALCSPHFLYRWELDNRQVQPGSIRELGDHELASRLSYFLWSSMPDAELLVLASKGELRKDGNLEKQVARMLQDWRSRGLVDNFASQWLQTRAIYEIEPDPNVFPKFDYRLREAMKQETSLFFEAIMKENRPVTDLIAADFTFVNERLAKHYGIDGVKGDKFQRVQLPPGSPRGGVLTQGAVLMVTSTPTRTAPVIRGKWILEQLLGAPPPPPPPDVPPLPEQKQSSQSASLRQRLEQHRASAECSSCHAKMDPLGFALENFDAIGTWREMDGKFPIDASGKIPGSGTAFNGASDLKRILKDDPRFIKALATNMMIYALGRGLEYFDRCAVDAVVANLAQEQNKFSALVTGIVTSEPFRKRKTEPLAQN
jgi:mono/diheme cytochrome c family protein